MTTTDHTRAEPTGFRRRRTYHQVGYRELVRLPVGYVPEICAPPPPTRSELRWSRRGWATGTATLAAMAAMLPMVTYADSIVTAYLAGKQELPTTVQLTNGTTASVTGTENFDARPVAAQVAGASMISTFGIAGAPITGTFSGTYGIATFDQFGGAGGAGRYITTTSAAGISVKFTHTAAVPGVNYFGIDITALDAPNQLAIYRSGMLLQSFSAATLKQALGTCPNASNPYSGNPTTGLNNAEPYAFLSIFDLSDYFDEIRLTQTAASGGFESDNYTVGYRNPNVVFGNLVSVPEPASVLLLTLGLVGLALVRTSGRAGSITVRAAVRWLGKNETGLGLQA